MRKKIILGILTCIILSACQRNEELTEIESLKTDAVENAEGKIVHDLTFADGTPADYSIEDIKIVVVYEEGVSEAQKAQLRAEHTTVFGGVQVAPCSLNPKAEIWSYRDLIIHNWEDVSQEFLNLQLTQPLHDDDIVERPTLLQISHKIYDISDSNIICN